jgi:hypothetical protein
MPGVEMDSAIEVLENRQISICRQGLGFRETTNTRDRNDPMTRSSFLHVPGKLTSLFLTPAMGGQAWARLFHPDGGTGLRGEKRWTGGVIEPRV